MFVPKTFRDTDDRLATILLSAPDFEVINKHRTTRITLDEMMESLRSGINSVAATTKNSDALAMFQRCLEDVNVAHQLYRENKITEAKRLIQAASILFEQAGKLRRKKDLRQAAVDEAPDD